VVAQVWNVLQESRFMSQRNMIEQHEMLMQLSHVSNMRDYGEAKYLCQETDGQELAHSRNSCAVDLDIVKRLRLHKRFE